MNPVHGLCVHSAVALFLALPASRAPAVPLVPDGAPKMPRSMARGVWASSASLFTGEFASCKTCAATGRSGSPAHSLRGARWSRAISGRSSPGCRHSALTTRSRNTSEREPPRSVERLEDRRVLGGLEALAAGQTVRRQTPVTGRMAGVRRIGRRPRPDDDAGLAARSLRFNPFAIRHQAPSSLTAPPPLGSGTASSLPNRSCIERPRGREPDQRCSRLLRANEPGVDIVQFDRHHGPLVLLVGPELGIGLVHPVHQRVAVCVQRQHGSSR